MRAACSARAARGGAISLAELMQATLTEGAVVGRGVSTKLPLGVEIGAHVCDVAVDTATGLVTVLRYTAFQDVGLALNPAAVEGQMEGSVVQGLGWALTEGFDYGADGRLRNASLLDYRMPTALDVPKIDCVIVETPVPNVPYGVRGVGEVPIVPPAAAVANAIARATGVRITRMPMTPERVLAALKGEEQVKGVARLRGRTSRRRIEGYDTDPEAHLAIVRMIALASRPKVKSGCVARERPVSGGLNPFGSEGKVLPTRAP